jgi:hypothetical protein
MLMTAVWWILILAAFGVLASSVDFAISRRRRGIDTQLYAAGGIPAAAAFVLLIVVQIVGFEGTLELALFGATVLLLIIAALVARAVRRKSGKS